MDTMFQTIKNDFLTVQVNLRGAELWSIQDAGGREYLWQGSPAYWSDRAPTLFPYIARMTEKSYLLDGQKYHMDIHGFAKDSVFEIAAQESDMLTLLLCHTEETLVQYPFKFDFYITFQLMNDTLVTEYKVINRNDRTMYFGIGGHPGFHVPLDEGLHFEDYYLEFCGAGEPKRVVFSEDCFVMDGQFTPFKLPADGRYPLSHDMFDQDAIVLKDMPRQITLASDKGSRRLQVSYPDMPYLGLWHMPHTDAPYICIEPWSSLPSRKDMIEDLAAQENLVALAADETYVNRWSIRILQA